LGGNRVQQPRLRLRAGSGAAAAPVVARLRTEHPVPGPPGGGGGAGPRRRAAVARPGRAGARAAGAGRVLLPGQLRDEARGADRCRGVGARRVVLRRVHPRDRHPVGGGRGHVGGRSGPGVPGGVRRRRAGHRRRRPRGARGRPGPPGRGPASSRAVGRPGARRLVSAAGPGGLPAACRDQRSTIRSIFHFPSCLTAPTVTCAGPTVLSPVVERIACWSTNSSTSARFPCSQVTALLRTVVVTTSCCSGACSRTTRNRSSYFSTAEPTRISFAARSVLAVSLKS